MIVDPDFLDHWRTRMVVNALRDELAPLGILRLWSHCQQRKSDRFEMPTEGLKAQCRYQGDAEAFEQALVDAKFVARNGEEIIVLGWAEQNASLIAAWENGSKGGRPKKLEQNPTETHVEPDANPTLTQTKPRREEKIGVDKKESSKKIEARGSRLPSTWVAPPEYIEFCKTKRPDLDPVEMSEKFRDYWSGISGQKGCKTNWLGTWRNFIRSEHPPPKVRGSPAKPEKFDPVAHVNRTKDPPNERTFTFDAATGEPV